MVIKHIRRPRFYGWISLAGTMLVYGCICGDLTYAYGVFLPSMCEEFGCSRSVLSGPYTVFMITIGILCPVAGISISRFGGRKNIVVSHLLLVMTLAGMSVINEIWHIYLLIGILGGITIAFGEFIPATDIVNRWFIKKRSLAMGLVLASGGIGGFVYPPLISWLISSLGWRAGWACLAGIHLVLVVIIGGTLIRSKPEDVGQVPDGGVSEKYLRNTTSVRKQKRVYETPVDWKVKDALCTPAFWLIVTVFSAAQFTMNILSTHQVAYLQDVGFSHMTASTSFGLMIGASIIGRVFCGVMGTTYEGRYLATASLALFAVGIIFLMNAKALPFVYISAILNGISYGGLVVLIPVMFGAYFGRTNFARIIGWTVPVITIVCAASPLMAGFIYDSTGKYTLAFWIAAALLGMSVICALLARPPKPPVALSP